MPNTDIGGAAWALASVAVSRTLIRLTLCALAVHAARKALDPTPNTKTAARVRAHRLAILRALLNTLKPPRR
ncbi:hypothetical protein ACFVT5_09130 [Streptomyces sp. NPDC058001]|uniref:hypothetical protein n=1 Tax=Streptomyces sp. NPDC058001 TaxID=3346300 RepID=UPI0036E35CA9